MRWAFLSSVMGRLLLNWRVGRVTPMPRSRAYAAIGLRSRPVADLVVKSDTRLDEFLRSNGVQQWRVPILAKYGGVVVVRGKKGPRVQLSGEATPLKAKDIVKLASPLPKPCADALQQEADKNWRDYAIAPGIDEEGAPLFNERMRKFLKVRTNTILIDTTQNLSMANVQGFLKGIATSELITHPIRDLIVAGHASGVSGVLKIDLTPQSTADFVRYEDLEQAVKDRSLIANVALMQPRPKGAGPARMRLFGCAVGRAAPFMTKLKEALGNQMLVSAPNNLLIGAEFSGRVGGSKFTGQLAYMDYAFRLYLVPPKTKPGKKRPARNKKDIVAAFAAATKVESDKSSARKLTQAQIDTSVPGQFQRQDRKYVTKAQWQAWVPDNPEDKRWFVRDPSHPAPTRHQIPNLVKLPVFPVRTDAPRQFQVRLGHKLWDDDPQTGPPNMPLAKDPGDDGGRKKAVKAWLQGDRRLIWTDKHPFPAYVRAGYETMDEFMDGFDWQFDYDATTKRLAYNAIRDEYAVEQPITNKLGVLMLDYYTEKPPPTALEKKIPIEMLLIQDRFFFTTY
jgi:hypothetical protein